MKLIAKILIFTPLAFALNGASCRLMPHVASATPTVVVRESTIVEPLIKPVETPTPQRVYSYRREGFKPFKDSVSAFMWSMKASQDGFSAKQDIMLSKMDTAMSRQRANNNNINNLLYILNQQNTDIKRLNNTITLLTNKSAVSKETKEQAQFSQAFTVNAVRLNFGMLGAILIIGIINLILALRKNTNLKTLPK